MLMHFASAQPDVSTPPSLLLDSPVEPEEVTPPSGGRRSPSFSHPFGGKPVEDTAEKDPPSLSRTASEIDGINVLLGLSNKRAASAGGKSGGKRRRTASQTATPAAKRSLQVVAAPEIVPSKCQPLSGAKTEQLKVLAVAFSLCSAPSHAQTEAIAARAGLNAERVTEWFRARSVLQAWLKEQMQRQPNASADEMVRVVWRRQAAAF